MKKLVLLTLLAANVSQADIITCRFTEPFYTKTYSTTQSTLTTTYGLDKPIVEKNVSFQIKSAGVFDLVSKSGKVLLTVELDYSGSDGMSDTEFPYSVKDGSNYGGCESNYQPAKRMN